MQKQSTSYTFYFFFVIATLAVLFAGCAQETPSVFSTSTQTVEAKATATATIQSPPTSLSNTSYEDTGYEGYYNGIVVITEYYTLLGNGLYEEAYQILSPSARLHSQSQVEFVTAAQLAFKAVEIVNVQPLVVWQREQGVLSVMPDEEDKIRFHVQIRAWGKGNMSGSVKSGDLQTLFLTVIKEDGEWKIDSFATGLVTPTSEPAAIPTIDPGSVPDRSYYDSIIVIAQFHGLFNHGLYQQAYQLLSPFRRNAQSLDEFIFDIETFGIIERSIVSIHPFYEGTLQLQTFTTPDPVNRRMFYTQIYARGKSGWAGPVPNGVHGYYITTVLENEKWKIYSVNTAGIP